MELADRGWALIFWGGVLAPNPMRNPIINPLVIFKPTPAWKQPYLQAAPGLVERHRERCRRR